MPASISICTVYPRRCGEQRQSKPYSSAYCRFIPAGAGNSEAGLLVRIGSAVYPRRCGEQGATERDSNSIAGLSPQVRGTVTVSFLKIWFERFIPAGAGNRPFWGTPMAAGPVYPRRCGEQQKSGSSVRNLIGLSPQVRGTATRPIIGMSCSTVYPRRCGEQGKKPPPNQTVSGLSPQVRGTGRSHFIACSWRSVYPRRCGEQARRSVSRSEPTGLSPQVRGTGPGPPQ